MMKLIRRFINGSQKPKTQEAADFLGFLFPF